MTAREKKAERECVAVLVAQGLWPVSGKYGIAVRCNVSVPSITAWKKEPKFQERVQQIREEAEANVDKLFLSSRTNRLQLYSDQARRLVRLQEARAKAYDEDPDVIGGDTGAMVKKKTVKRVNGKDEHYVTVETNYDKSIDSTLMELAKQAAIERGEWSEKREMTGKDGSPLIPITEVLIDRSAGNTPEG